MVAAANSVGEDSDRVLSYTELRGSLDKVDVHAERMLQCLRLDADMTGMLLKLPLFCVCVSCFVAAMCEFVPPVSIHNVHRHIEQHFALHEVRGIKDYEGLYEYMELFEERNGKLQATSTQYWCERRYSEHRWDDHLLIPVWECPSPRQYALSLLDDESIKWSVLNAVASSNSSRSTSSSGGSGIASSGSSNRPAGDDGDVSDGIHALRPPPPCEDDDETLKREEADPNVTCASFASHICDTDLGILLCPQTCNYCAPFTYDHLRKFAKPQLTMLPTMVYQSRFHTGPCHGFAHTYETQPFNPVLTLLPALDGKKNGKVLPCVDRQRRWEEDHAVEVKCPANGPVVHCHNGMAKFTQKHTFHGLPIYPKILIEPHRDILALKAIDWLDHQTEAVTLSTMIYSEGSEIFTSLSVTFWIDEAGNVDGSHHLISYRDLTDSSKTAFIGCLSACAAGALTGVLLSAHRMLRHPEQCRWGHELYELFSRGVLVVYPLVLLISWFQQIPMAEEYDSLLHSFLDLRTLKHEDVEEAIQEYFDVKTHLYEETTWLMRHRVASYLVCYVEFLQLVFYLSYHPKMGILVATVFRAMSNIMHFLILFTSLFLLLASMAHWTLGAHVTEFGTYGDTVKSQARMMYGEFIESEDAANKLGGLMLGIYWFYALTFMTVVWMTLLNFFLAIVVDAFHDVKKDKGNALARSFLSDILNTLWTWILAARMKWPARRDLIAFFEDVVERHEDRCVLPQWLLELAREDQDEPESEALARSTPHDIVSAFPENFDKNKVTRFLLHYFAKSDEVLLERVGEGGAHNR